MPIHRVLTEFGMGTSLRRQDYTQAARRGLQDALWHNSINMAELFGFSKEAMLIDVQVGVQQPDQVDADSLLDIFIGYTNIIPSFIIGIFKNMVRRCRKV